MTAVSPNSGSIAGGSAVTITGQFFAPNAIVTFDGIPALNVTVVSDTKITVTTPPHPATGAVNVAVTVVTNTGTLPNGYTYGVVQSLPSSDSSSGTTGSPGTLPGSRSPGSSQGGSPNALPPPR